MRRPARLLADVMLGSLARWLRILGIDTVYDRHARDAELVERAVAEGRTLLTRDRRLVQRRRARDHVLIRSDRLDEQIGQVVEELGLELDPRRTFGRCVRCNEPLARLPPEAARPRVPPYVARTQREFRRCPACGRIYWAATHVERMRERLRRMGLGR